MSDLGKRLRAYREALGYSLSEINQKTGITNSRLSRIEQGRVDCPPGDLRKLANVYGVNTVSLFLAASYLEPEDLTEYQLYFRGADKLDEEEHCHIQNQIDFLVKKKGKENNDI